MKPSLCIILIALATTGHCAVTLDVRSGTIYNVLTNGVSLRITNALPPVISPDGGLLPGGSTNVTFTAPGCMVFWTTNGATPGTNGAGIASGSTVTISTTNFPLKALAWTNDGRLPSVVVSATFTNAPAAPAEGFTLTGENTDTTGRDYRQVGASDYVRYQWTLVTIPVGANLAKFDFLMGVGAGTPTGYLTGLVHSVSGSTPTATQLGISEPVNVSELAALGTSNWLSFTLTSPVSTTTPVTVALGVTCNQDAGNYPHLWTPEGFLENGVWASPDTSTFTNAASRQLNFRTYSSP